MALSVMYMISCACVDRSGDSNALYIAGEIKVYPDSIVCEDRAYVARGDGEISNAWITALADSADVTAPRYKSGCMMADALWRKGLEQMDAFPAHSEDVWLTTAILQPDKAKEILRGMVTDGRIRHKGFPLVADNCAWTAAAWEVYCATGDEEWLKEAYRVTANTLEAEESVLLTPDGFIRGGAGYLHPLEAGTSVYPAWMLPVDVGQTVSLGVNVWHHVTLMALAKMAEAIHHGSGQKWEAKSSRLREEINDAFWVPSESRYGMMVYGDYYGMLSSMSDNLAAPLAVITGVPTPEMSRRIVDGTVSLPRGTPLVFPKPEGCNVEYNSLTQSLQGIAAARVSSEEGMLRAIGPLWVMSLDDHAVSRWPAMLMRGILGITLSTAGMKLSPVIPSRMAGDKVIEGLAVREALVDIHVHGTGDRIASFALDSVNSSNHIIPWDLKGSHRIDITMAGNPLPSQSNEVVLMNEPVAAPVTPKVYWETPRDGRIINFDKSTTYNIYVNGVMDETLSEPAYQISDSCTAVISIVPVCEGIEGFSPQAHVSAPADAVINIPATAITPRRPPIHLIRDRKLASKYIEMAARHNTRMTFYVQAPSTGTYFLKVFYANGTTETALRTVEVNEAPSGVIMCPAVNTNDWVTVRPSSTLEVHLVEGVNKLSLTYVNTTILLNRIYLLRK